MSEAFAIEPVTRNLGAAVPIPNRDELIAEICERIANGESLTKVCESPGMPKSNTFFRWLSADDSAWTEYLRAREAQAHHYAARVMDEALSATDAQLGRLRVDALKWAAGKLAPKFYGDNMQLRHADADGDKLNTQPLVSELLSILPGGAPQARNAPIDVTPRDVTPMQQEYTPRARRTAPPAQDVDDLV